MRIYFLCKHPCVSAEFFHLCPYTTAVQRFAGGSEKYAALFDSFLLCVAEQFTAKLSRQQYHPYFPFAAYFGPSGFSSLCRNIAMLRYADSGGGHGLHQQSEAPVIFCCLQQSFILFPAEFMFFPAKGRMLIPQLLYPSV